MTPVRVLWTIDKLSMDGVNPSCISQNLVEAVPLFNANKIQFVVCDLRPREPGGKILENAGIPVWYLGKGKYSPLNFSALVSLIRREKISLLHCHGYNAANFGRMAGRFCNIPVIVHEHGVLKIQAHQYIADLVLRRFTTAGVAVSEAVKEFMVSGRAVPRNIISVLPNGISLDKFRSVPDSETAAIRKELKIANECRIIGSVGRLDPVKGIDHLVQAVPEIVREFPYIKIVLVGEGSMHDELVDMTRRLKIENNVVFAGFRQNVAPFFAMFDVVVMPSISEGFPYTAIEALASRTPLVATRVGGLPEIIEHAKNGWLVPEKDSAALAHGICTILRDQTLAENLALEGEKRAGAFSLESYVRKLERLYIDTAGPLSIQQAG